MWGDAPLLAALPAIAAFIALPGVMAWWRRRATREASEVAVALTEFATALRRDVGKASCCPPFDAGLAARLDRLRVPESASLQFVQELPDAHGSLLADTAQRLALRLRRRIAFERKMLARTASGRRRGAVAAAMPPLVLLMLEAFGVVVPGATLEFVVCIEAFGCWLLWRLARVGI
jgi:Flp pilus assembly protein TadB